jgi:hypothetical protein
MPESLRTIEFFETSRTFFRYLSRQERMRLLKTLADADAMLPKAAAAGSAVVAGVGDGAHEGSAIGEGSALSSAAAAHRPIGNELSSPTREPFPAYNSESVAAFRHSLNPHQHQFHTTVPPSSSVSARGGIDLIRDPRTGVMKTPIMMFGEMFEEDRARALLLHMNGRSLDAYLTDLIGSANLDSAYLDELNDAVMRPLRGGSSTLQRGQGSGAAHGGDESNTAAGNPSPSRSISLLLRRGTMMGEGTGIAPPMTPSTTTLDES